MRDTLFNKDVFGPGGFDFDHQVVKVFDDMIERSVPYYNEILKLSFNIICNYFAQKTHICLYDLGCSTGNFLSLLQQNISEYPFTIDYKGVDKSDLMLDRLRAIKITDPKIARSAIPYDLTQLVSFETMESCLVNLVLQFLSPKARLPLLKNIYNSLSPGGLCFVVEKIYIKDASLQYMFTKQYHSFKQTNGYTLEEIKNKDRSLNNVLVPLTLNENMQMLQDAGFKDVHVFFQWFNFVGILAVKGG